MWREPARWARLDDPKRGADRFAPNDRAFQLLVDLTGRWDAQRDQGLQRHLAAAVAQR